MFRLNLAIFREMSTQRSSHFDIGIYRSPVCVVNYNIKELKPRSVLYI
jgi:hypothetical protein